MNFWNHVRAAGAVTVIIAYFLNNLLLNLIGLMIIAVGVVGHVSNLEERVKALENKGVNDEEA